MQGDTADDTHPIEDKLDDWARVCCPNGHTSLVDQDGDLVYCIQCRQCYDYDVLIDKRETPLSERVG